MTMYDDDRVVTLLRDIAVPAAPADRLGEVNRRARAAESRRASVVAAATALVLFGGVAGAVSLHGRSTTQVLTVADAARTTQDAGSARMSLRITVLRSTSAALPVGDLIRLAGPVDFRAQRFDFTGTFQKTAVEFRGIGKDEWTKIDLRSSFAAAAGGPHKPWIHSIRKVSASLLDRADPTELLDALTKQGTTLRRTTQGDRTTTLLRISADAVGAGLAGGAGKEIDLTVESDSHGRIREMRYDADAAGFGTTRATLRYDDFGVDVQVSPPPADQVQETPSPSGGGVQTKTFSSTVGSSPADRQRACEMLKQFETHAPKPTTPEQKAGYDRFLSVARKACGAK